MSSKYLLSFLIILVLLLSSCSGIQPVIKAPAADSVPTVANQVVENTPEATQAVRDAIATVSEPTSQEPVASCFELSLPDNASSLPGTGPVSFTWTEQPGTFKYITTITKPSGEEVSITSSTNSFSKNMELLPDGGIYKWKVNAYDASINLICSAGPWTFSKTGATQPTATPPSISDGCVSLLTPANGSDFPGPAKVDFTWTEYPNAYKYFITFKPPYTPAYSFLAWSPLHTRYVESFAAGGTYQWWVTVKDRNNNDICTSQAFNFTKPETVEPTQSNGLFHDQNGPTGSVSSCGSLYFSVKTYGPSDGTIKVIYSTARSSPDGNSDPHIVIGNAGDTSGSGSMTLPNDGSKVYWRFAVYNGTYKYDTQTYSFTCPNSVVAPQFSGQSGPTGAQSSCASLAFSVTTPLTGTVKIIYSTTNSSPDGNVDPHLVFSGSAPGTFSQSFGDFSSLTGSTVYWRFAVYNGNYIHDTNIYNFSCP
jgi:hypothetical protein